MADEVAPIPTDTPSQSAAPADTSAAPDYAGFASRMSQSLSDPAPASQDAPATAPAQPAPADVQEPAAATTDASDAATPPAAAPEATAFNESDWLSQQFGDKYKTPAEVKAELEQVEALRGSQLTDEHRRSLALLSEPETAREYLRLTTTDYEQMPVLDVMRENFARKNTHLDTEEVDVLFQRHLKANYPAFVDSVDPSHPDFEDTAEYRADKLLLDKQAARDKTELTDYRDTRTAELMAGVKAGAAPEPAAPAERSAEDQAVLDAHFAKVTTLAKDALDLTVELPDGQKVSIKARETPEEQAAAEQIMRAPFQDYENFLYPDGKTLDYNALELWTAFRTQGQKLLATAVAIGRDSAPPHVTLDNLTNGGADNRTPAPVTNDMAGFAARMRAAAQGQ